MANRTGQSLGNYRLVRLLGQGGFAEVYLGEHVHLGTEAAIKLLHTQLGPEETDAFRREARTIARLLHPHIVRVLDFGIDGTIPFLVMDYAPRGTVRTRYPKGVVLPLPTILTSLQQVASALQYAHDAHLIHRDVKPENLLLGRQEEILLGDFGIALLTQTSRSQSTQDVAGTASYMAPEQLQGKPRPASDQYALGIIVYEWLTGSCPFHGSFTEIASQHLFTPPPPLQGRTPAISPEVEQVVMTALAKDPGARFASVQAFATAFEQASQKAAATRSTPSHPLGTTLSTYRGHSSEVRAVAWSPDGRRIASGGEYRAVQIWDANTGKNMVTCEREYLHVSTVAWSPDGTRIASGGNDQYQVWEATTGKDLLAHPWRDVTVSAVAWSPDGTRIALGNDVTIWQVVVFDVTNGAWDFTYRGHSSGVFAVAWSPDGRRIASGGNDGTVQVWDAADGGHVFTYRGHSSGVFAVAWSPDGRRIASGGEDRTVQIWDAIDGSHPFTYRGHSNLVRAVTWSPDGRRIASASDTTVQVWKAV